MRKFFVAAVSAVAILFAGVATVQPAEAVSQSATVAIPPDANGYKFWSPSICIDGSAINGAYYRVATIAQQWNVVAQGALALDYSNDCAADGYPPSRRMVVGTFSNASLNSCLIITNNATAGYHGFARWTEGPGAYINIGLAGCADSQARRDKAVSVAIGYPLGLTILNSAAYNSRVMNNTGGVTLPEYNSGDTLFNIYSNVYCQPAGTTC